MFYRTTFVLQTFLIVSKLHATWYNNMQHDTTTHNKVVKRYKLFLHNKCCMLLHEKLGSFDRGLRNKIGDESPTVKVSITSAVRITSTTISCSNFGVVIHKLLWWSLQTFVAIFTNFSSDSYKLLPHCLQTFAFILLAVHKLFEAMFTETFAVRAFVVMLL